MTTTPRIRLHADGRFAILAHLPQGLSWVVQDQRCQHVGLTEDEVHDEGWSEGLVVALPEPDGPERHGGFGASVAYPEGVTAWDGPNVHINGYGYIHPDQARRLAAAIYAAADRADALAACHKALKESGNDTTDEVH